MEAINLFTYGTLMWPEVLAAVSGLQATGEPATLEGYKRMRVKGEAYPVIIQSEHDSVDGVLYRNLPEHIVERLDAFEGEAYDRKAVSLNGMTALTYVLSEDWLHIADTKRWHPEQLSPEQLETFLG